MEGNLNSAGADGLGARAEGDRVVIEIGRDVGTTYNAAVGAIELRMEPAEAQAFASAVMAAADLATRGGGRG